MDQGSTVLVTGATGLVGAHLLYALTAQGQRVRAIRRHNSSTNFVEWVFGLYTQTPNNQLDMIDWVEADLLDYDSLQVATVGVQTVYHAGAVVSFSPADSQSILATNVLGVANLVDACIYNGVAELCHISSVASLGKPNSQGIIDEQCDWTTSRGRSVYAQSKFLGENQAWRAMEMGMRVVVLNPSVILGPGRWESGSGQLFSRVKRGMPFYTNGTSGYVDVRDVAKAAIALMEDASISGDRFVLNAENVTFADLFGMMADAMGRRHPWFRVPRWTTALAYPLLWLGGLISGKGNSLSWANLQSAFKHSHYSSQKIVQRIGFEFIPIEQSINFIAKQMG